MTTFKNEVEQPQPRTFGPYDRLLVDKTTGAPIGIQNPSANGDDGYFYPVPLTAAQITSPPPGVLANKYVTYALNVFPYTRYYSDGTGLVSFTSDAPGDILMKQAIYAPWNITRRVTLYDQTRLYAWPT